MSSIKIVKYCQVLTNILTMTEKLFMMIPTKKNLIKKHLMKKKHLIKNTTQLN